jgi:hypothetical protein
MLPGFRFLFAAIMLSTSMLVFGLGAAALLRAAHEQFASNPSWHAAPEATFAQQSEPVTPVLAMLHAEPAPVEPKAPDNVSGLNTPSIAPPVEQTTNVATPAEPTAVSPAAAEPTSVAPASEPDRVAALKPEQTSAPEPAAPAKPVVAEDPAPGLAAPVQNEIPAAEATGSATSSSQSDSTPAPTKQAAIAPGMPPASETVASTPSAAETAPTETAPTQGEANAASEAGAASQPAMDAISTKLAVLDSRGVIVQPKPRPTAAIARSEMAAKKRRAADQRRRIAEQTRQIMAPPLPFPPFPQSLNQPQGATRNH